MRNRFFIIAPLMIAYLLMLFHDVIPHHHHDTLGEAAHHHAVEHTDHDHQGGDAEGHEHTLHLVHSPEFGSYLPGTFSSNQQPGFVCERVIFFEWNDLFSSIPSEATTIQWREENPPPLLNQKHTTFTFRGPPKQFLFA
jgi:hypothetical protein